MHEGEECAAEYSHVPTPLRPLQIEGAPNYEMVEPLSGEMRNDSEEEKEGSVICRICLEAESADNPLLHPCKCTGTVRYIHEACLKAWLSSHSADVTKSQCELCHTAFRMTTHVARKCAPREALHEGIAPCLFIPLLLSIIGLLAVIIYLLSDRYLSKANSDEQRGYASALVVVCALCMVVIGYLVLRSVREACCSRRLLQWSIHNREEVPEVARDNKVTPAVDHTTAPTNLDVHSEDEEERVSEPPILVLPKRITVNGMRVRTPDLPSASLASVHQRGRIVAVTPRTFVYPASFQQSRVVTPLGMTMNWPESAKAFPLSPCKSEILLPVRGPG